MEMPILIITPPTLPLQHQQPYVQAAPPIIVAPAEQWVDQMESPRPGPRPSASSLQRRQSHQQSQYPVHPKKRKKESRSSECEVASQEPSLPSCVPSCAKLRVTRRKVWRERDQTSQARLRTRSTAMYGLLGSMAGALSCVFISKCFRVEKVSKVLAASVRYTLRQPLLAHHPHLHEFGK